MKYFLTVLLLSESSSTARHQVQLEVPTPRSTSFMSLTKEVDSYSDCEVLCLAPVQLALKTNSEPTVCRAAQIAIDCFKSQCGRVEPTEVSENDLRRQGYTCHLSGSSTVSGSLLAVFGALLLTAYRALIK